MNVFGIRGMPLEMELYRNSKDSNKPKILHSLTLYCISSTTSEIKMGRKRYMPFNLTVVFHNLNIYSDVI